MREDSPKKHRLLIVGAGSIGERHLRCFLKTGRAEIMVCEPNEPLRNDIAGRYGVAASADFDAALKEAPWQGVVVCTPAHLHVSMAREALQAGASVLIEKPLSVSAEGTGDLVIARAENNRAAGVAYVLRFMPAIRQARTFLKSGAIGQPLHGIVVTGQHFPEFRPAYREIYYNRHETGGGAIQDALTHSAHSMEWLLGPTDSLFCDASHQALEGVEVEDTVNVLARNGRALVNYALNQFQAPNESHFWIHCAKGSIKIESHRQRWGVLRPGEKTWAWRDAPVDDRDDLFTAQAHAFLDAIEGKPTELCTLEEGIQTLKFNLAALESARTGRRVEL
jgi:predicted dehydrogenase